MLDISERAALLDDSGFNESYFKEFTPFEQDEPLPEFPLDMLPPATRAFVYAAAENIQAPIQSSANGFFDPMDYTKW